MMFPVIPRNQTRHFPRQALFLVSLLLRRPDESSIMLFEREVAAMFGAGFGIAFSSARSALSALLETAGYPRGATILMPSLNYPAIPRTVHERGFGIAWVPVREPGLGPDFRALESRNPHNTAALIWPHYFGFPAPADELLNFCAENGIDLIEDCAHAQGATFRGRSVGGFGRASFVSFETSKMLNTFGGGMILTSEPELADRLRALRLMLPARPPTTAAKGLSKSYAEAIATNRWVFSFALYPALYRAKVAGRRDFLEEELDGPGARAVARFTPFQAGVGLKAIEYLERNLRRLRKQWEKIQKLLDEAGLGGAAAPGGEPNGYMTAGLHSEAGKLSALFFRRGIDVKMRYMQDCRDLGFGDGAERCPRLSDKLFHIPLRTGLSERGETRYLEVIRDTLKDFSG